MFVCIYLSTMQSCFEEENTYEEGTRLFWGEMREAGMKCKVELLSFQSEEPIPLCKRSYCLSFISISARLTRSRKVVAESSFRYQFIGRGPFSHRESALR